MDEEKLKAELLDDGDLEALEKGHAKRASEASTSAQVPIEIAGKSSSMDW